MLEPEQLTSNNDILDNNHLRLGMNRWLQIFTTQSFYIFRVRQASTSATPDDAALSTGSNAGNVSHSEQALGEKSIIGLVSFYRKLPQRHTPDRPTW